MPDRLRSYLAQQADLGGREIYLPAPLEPALANSSPASSTETTGPLESARAEKRQGGPAEERSPAGPDAQGKWRKDAPAIPGAGCTVEPPELGLLGDTIFQLESLDQVAAAVRECRRCRLCEGRRNAVPGEGDRHSGLMCVGEGPGETEDQTGRPFVGRAGELLTQILSAIDLPRESVYIANIVKCRPPQNRKPLPDEAAACLPFLHRQIALIRPRVLLALGGTAAEALLGVRKSIGELRGKVHRYGTVPLVVTYHPAALLRNPHWKKPTWDDVRIARQLLER